MRRLECWAEIPNEKERKAVMAWVRAGKFKSYSEIDTRVNVTYEDDPNDQDSSGRYWGIVHFFESYPEHHIYSTNS